MNTVSFALALLEDFGMSSSEAIAALTEVDKATLKKQLQKGMKASLAKVKDKAKRETMKTNMLKAMNLALSWFEA